MGVGSVTVHPSGAAGAENDSVGADHLDLTIGDIQRDHAFADALVIDSDCEHHPLLIIVGIEADGLLVKRVQQVEPGFVGAVAGARIARAAERTLCDLAIGGARERATPVLHFEDDARSIGGHGDGGLLVGQEVGALDGIESMAFGRIVMRIGIVGQGGVDTTLGGAGVRAKRVSLSDERNVRAAVSSLDGGPHTGQSTADYKDIMKSHGYLLRARNAKPGEA